ncbi:MAG: S41 family peptidase [Candidatus Dojkabacteria bacterium]|nr:MAG: S41 family peptidase [Candidatus Dojkabacteria bacterium]
MEVCKIVFENSIFAEGLVEHALQRDVVEMASSDGGYYTALEHILSALRKQGDNHSYLSSVGQFEQPNSEASQPKAEFISSCGYIEVPGISGFDESEFTLYIERLRGYIKEMDEMGVEGWIIDLRSNNGGNMQPMIAGIGELFDSEVLGYFISKGGKRYTWGFRGGYYLYNNVVGIGARAMHGIGRKPIALLVGSATASSGEMVLVSFMGNSNTRTFGNHSAGYLTGVTPFKLPCGRILGLATAQVADRNGTVQSGVINPDVVCDEDNALALAIKWIRTQE